MSVVITLYVVASLFPENYTTKKRTFRKKRYTDLALRRPQIRICYGSRWKLISRKESYKLSSRYSRPRSTVVASSFHENIY